MVGKIFSQLEQWHHRCAFSFRPE